MLLEPGFEQGREDTRVRAATFGGVLVLLYCDDGRVGSNYPPVARCPLWHSMRPWPPLSIIPFPLSKCYTTLTG